MKYLKIIFIMLITLVLFGCETNNTMDEGDFKITIGSEFKKEGSIIYKYVYNAPYAHVYVQENIIDDIKEYGLNEDSTLEEYANYVTRLHNRNYTYTKKDNKVYFSYSNDDSYYLGVVCKGENSFWFIGFLSIYETKNNYKDKFLEWADSVEV